MADDWRDRFRSWSYSGKLANANSPAGGSGSGFSRVPGYTYYYWSRLPHLDSPAGRHLHWVSALRQKQIVANRSDVEKLSLAVEGSLPKLPRQLREKVSAMLTPKALATLAAIAAVWSGSHWIGVGEAVDVVLLGWGVWTLGPEALDVARDLYEFVTTAARAQTDKDIDRAADHFARAVAVIGVDGLAAVLTHKAFKAVREMKGGAGGPRRTGGGGYADEAEVTRAELRTTTKEQWREQYRKERIAKRQAKYGPASEKHVNDQGHAADGKRQTLDQQAMKIARKMPQSRLRKQEHRHLRKKQSSRANSTGMKVAKSSRTKSYTIRIRVFLQIQLPVVKYIRTMI